MYFKDAAKLIKEQIPAEVKKRDPYLHRLYKIQLQEESQCHFAKMACMVECLQYPVLIASHIKPFILCDDDEAYDVSNGILLSKTIDSLFDLGYITFDEKGNIICSDSLSNDVCTHIKSYQLNSKVLTDTRLAYLSYHRNNVFKTP